MATDLSVGRSPERAVLPSSWPFGMVFLSPCSMAALDGRKTSSRRRYVPLHRLSKGYQLPSCSLHVTTSKAKGKYLANPAVHVKMASSSRYRLLCRGVLVFGILHPGCIYLHGCM